MGTLAFLLLQLKGTNLEDAASAEYVVSWTPRQGKLGEPQRIAGSEPSRIVLWDKTTDFMVTSPGAPGGDRSLCGSWQLALIVNIVNDYA